MSLDDIAEFLGKSSLALDKSAQHYDAADQAIITHLAEITKSLDDLGDL